MGALHPGHVSLIEAAKARADEVVVSIFVNPTQFRPGEDFERYPRTPEHDLELCKAAGVDYVFMPTVETIYPSGPNAVTICVGSVGDRWEGAARPGHFDGVSTVVAQLFLTVKPHLAVFSLKDLQQCAVISKLVAGLRLGVGIILAPTVREPDGLAMSSRNRYLSTEDRAVAPQLFRALFEAKKHLVRGRAADAETELRSVAENLDARFDVQYLAIVNRESMEPASSTDRLAWLIAAVRLSGTRLIDNIALFD